MQNIWLISGTQHTDLHAKRCGKGRLGEMLLAESLEMADIFFSNKAAFLEGAAFEFVRPSLGYIVREDSADCPCRRNSFHC